MIESRVEKRGVCTCVSSAIRRDGIMVDARRRTHSTLAPEASAVAFLLRRLAGRGTNSMTFRMGEPPDAVGGRGDDALATDDDE